MIINNEVFISGDDCLTRYEDADIRKDTYDVYVYYSGFAYYHQPMNIKPKGYEYEGVVFGVTGKKVYLKGMIGVSDDFPLIGDTNIEDLIEEFNNRKLITTNRFLLVSGKTLDEDTILELDNPLNTDEQTQFYYRLNQLDEKAIKYGIDIKELKPQLPEKNIEISNQPLALQEKRELILKGWLAGKSLLYTEELLDYTREQLWEELRKIDSGIFIPASPETIKHFFKNQKLCSFQIGRRKGVN